VRDDSEGAIQAEPVAEMLRYAEMTRPVRDERSFLEFFAGEG
jgi:hypothetical protein